MSFKDKVVLVTGGSSGIGASAALAFAREGARVAIVGRNEAKLGGVAEQCAALGAAPLVLAADVSRDADLRRVVDTLIRHYGRLDVLINNAGILRQCAISDLDMINVYDEIMNTNLRSVVLLTNLCVPWLEKTKGNIINISSVAARSCNPVHIAYCVSKAGMNHFSKNAALELAAKNIRVNLVSPGPVQTDIFETAKSKFTWEQLKEMTALKKIAQPEDVAKLILFLASDDAACITGSDYLLDCGYLTNK